MEEVKFKVGDRVCVKWCYNKAGPYVGVVNKRTDGGLLDVDDIYGGFRETDGQYREPNIAYLEMVEPAPVKDGGGLRYDSDKLRLDLIPTEWTVELARVMTIGAYKYADRNWEKGMSWSKCIGCLERHFARWKSGHLADRETKCHELAMVAWNALALMTYELRGLGTDDRVTTAYDTDFKWTDGPGTELGLSTEQIADLKSKFKKDAK